jgi:hypothetical protein
MVVQEDIGACKDGYQTDERRNSIAVNSNVPRTGNFDDTTVCNVPLVSVFVEVVDTVEFLVQGNSFTLRFTHFVTNNYYTECTNTSAVSAAMAELRKESRNPCPS